MGDASVIQTGAFVGLRSTRRCSALRGSGAPGFLTGHVVLFKGNAALMSQGLETPGWPPSINATTTG